MQTCPCTPKKDYKECCEPYLKGAKKPPTAEALMRARYSAYVKGDIEFVENTLHPKARHDFDREAAKAWSEKSTWKGLEVVASELGAREDAEGMVEFVANFEFDGKGEKHHERAYFKKEEDEWYYVDGKMVQKPVVREEPKLGRNDPCSCGSGKKFKKCCAA